MATTVTASTLSVTVSEKITLNGVSRNGSTTLSVGSIKEISNRIIEVTNSSGGTELVEFADTPGAVGPGKYDKGAVKYLRLTNLDDTNFITVQSTDESAHHWEQKLIAGKSILFGNPSAVDAHADIESTSFVKILKIIAQADTAAVDVELYIAST